MAQDFISEASRAPTMWADRPRSAGPGDLSFFEAGAGSPLVLLHGVGLRAEAWCGVVPDLADAHRVICLDLPGHGLSPLNGAENLKDYVIRISAFLASLDVPVYLAGHSMGALLAVEVAAHAPTSVRSVAALNTVYKRDAQAAAAVQARAKSLVAATSVDPGPTLERWFGRTPGGAYALAAEACGRWLKSGSRQGYAAAYKVFAESDGPSKYALAALNCPALFVTAADDPNSTPAMSQALAARTGGASHAIQAAAHMVPMTHPQAVAQCLLDHFAGKSPITPQRG